MALVTLLRGWTRMTGLVMAPIHITKTSGTKPNYRRHPHPHHWRVTRTPTRTRKQERTAGNKELEQGERKQKLKEPKQRIPPNPEARRRPTVSKVKWIKPQENTKPPPQEGTSSARADNQGAQRSVDIQKIVRNFRQRQMNVRLRALTNRPRGRVAAQERTNDPVRRGKSPTPSQESDAAGGFQVAESLWAQGRSVRRASRGGGVGSRRTVVHMNE